MSEEQVNKETDVQNELGQLEEASENFNVTSQQLGAEDQTEGSEEHPKLIDMKPDEDQIGAIPVAAEQPSNMSANLRKSSISKGKRNSLESQRMSSNRMSNQGSYQEVVRRSLARNIDPLGTMFDDVRLKIEAQNDEINELKVQLELVESRFPPTADSRNEVNSIRKRINASLSKLNILYKDARQIQEKDPERAWPVLTFATTLAEDNDKTSGLDYGVVVSHIEPLSFPAEENTFCSHSTRSESEESLFNRFRVRGSRVITRPEKEPTKAERKRLRLQEELTNRDKAVERLHRKVLKMQAELARLCQEKQQQRFDLNSLNESCNDSVLNSGADDDCEIFKVLNKGFQKMQKDILNDQTEETCAGAQQGDFKRKYCELLEEYANKDCKIQKLQAQLQAVTTRSVEHGKDPIVDILRKQLDESREENDSQRVIICEQAEQIEDYHGKYVEALQKNEELKCIAKRMQMDNRKVEDQINHEIEQIKSKFESKLAEYAQYPKLLENEQLKVAQLTSDKQELERKLRIVCLEFKKLRNERDSLVNTENGTACKDCSQMQDKLNDALAQLDAMRQCYSAMTNKFDSAKIELDTLRKESAKVICRLKGRADELRVKMQTHIHRLESDLAKARAAISITSADKETTIKDMQGQLNCLSMCLDSSQKQIKTLKDHIAYLNNGKTKSVVCCQTHEKNL